MEMENIDMIMEIIFKEIILKMVKEAKENIILVKVVFLNLNLILHLLKFLKYIQQMVQFMLDNKEMDLEKDQVRLLMQMEVFMMDNGQVIKNMVMGNFNMLIKLNILVNGKMI